LVGLIQIVRIASLPVTNNIEIMAAPNRGGDVGKLPVLSVLCSAGLGLLAYQGSVAAFQDKTP